jgi:hypothetical protein
MAVKTDKERVKGQPERGQEAPGSVVKGQTGRQQRTWNHKIQIAETFE